MGDDRRGSFDSQFRLIGGLSNAPLFANLRHGREFNNGQYNQETGIVKLSVGTGNRCNLYVDTNIILESGIQPYAGLDDYGILCIWTFNGAAAPDAPNSQEAGIVRQENEFEGLPQPTGLSVGQMSFIEPVETIVASPFGSDTQHRQEDFGIYRLPIVRSFSVAGGSQQWSKPTIVIPTVARADYLRVFFWTNPQAFVFPGVDLYMKIWALVGADAQ